MKIEMEHIIHFSGSCTDDLLLILEVSAPVYRKSGAAVGEDTLQTQRRPSIMIVMNIWFNQGATLPRPLTPVPSLFGSPSPIRPSPPDYEDELGKAFPLAHPGISNHRLTQVRSI